MVVFLSLFSVLSSVRQTCFEGSHLYVFGVSVTIITIFVLVPSTLALCIALYKKGVHLPGAAHIIAESAVDEYRGHAFYFGLIEMLMVCEFRFVRYSFFGAFDGLMLD